VSRRRIHEARTRSAAGIATALAAVEAACRSNSFGAEGRDEPTVFRRPGATESDNDRPANDIQRAAGEPDGCSVQNRLQGARSRRRQ